VLGLIDLFMNIEFYYFENFEKFVEAEIVIVVEVEQLIVEIGLKAELVVVVVIGLVDLNYS
jgi:hypothetical protein